jgi:hypothetical protein
MCCPHIVEGLCYAIIPSEFVDLMKMSVKEEYRRRVCYSEHYLECLRYKRLQIDDDVIHGHKVCP